MLIGYAMRLFHGDRELRLAPVLFADPDPYVDYEGDELLANANGYTLRGPVPMLRVGYVSRHRPPAHPFMRRTDG